MENKNINLNKETKETKDTKDTKEVQGIKEAESLKEIEDTKVTEDTLGKIENNELSDEEKSGNKSLLLNYLIIPVFIAVFAGFLYFTGIIHLNRPDLKDIINAVEASTDINLYNPAEFKEAKINYGFLKDEIIDLYYLAPKSSMDTSEVLIARFKDRDTLNKYMEVVKKRSQSREEMFKSYKPLESEILKNSLIYVESDYLIFISSKDGDKIKKSLDKAFR